MRIPSTEVRVLRTAVKDWSIGAIQVLFPRPRPRIPADDVGVPQISVDLLIQEVPDDEGSQQVVSALHLKLIPEYCSHGTLMGLRIVAESEENCFEQSFVQHPNWQAEDTRCTECERDESEETRMEEGDG